MWMLSMVALGSAAYLFYKGSKRTTAQRMALTGLKDPVQIAKIRYASGEITRDEYEAILQELGEPVPELGRSSPV